MEKWIKDLTWSNRLFLTKVWPKIKMKCGGGKIKPVEIIRDNEIGGGIARTEDIFKAIDLSYVKNTTNAQFLVVPFDKLGGKIKEF